MGRARWICSGFVHGIWRELDGGACRPGRLWTQTLEGIDVAVTTRGNISVETTV